MQRYSPPADKTLLMVSDPNTRALDPEKRNKMFALRVKNYIEKIDKDNLTIAIRNIKENSNHAKD